MDAAFKHYKRRTAPAPDLGDVLDFNASPLPVGVTPWPLQPSTSVLEHGLQPVHEWRAYAVAGRPGFAFVCNPFTEAAQSDWVQRSLREYPRPGNVCNLDAHESGVHEGKSLWQTCWTRGDARKFRKLRWVTLGYHYDWTEKTYDDKLVSTFPPELAALTVTVAMNLGFPTFTAQAAISNYYHVGDTLAAHTDHSELYMDAPLVSVSFGCDAVLLLGGTDREEAPTPVRVRSGDITILSGPTRLAYHAVPRILPDTCPAALLTAPATWPEAERQFLVTCLRDGRINLNVRQVRP